jgi:hypothetical protein
MNRWQRGAAKRRASSRAQEPCKMLAAPEGAGCGGAGVERSEGPQLREARSAPESAPAPHP